MRFVLAALLGLVPSLGLAQGTFGTITPGGGSDIMQSVTLTLTASQLATLNSNPVTIVVQPGADNVLVPLSGGMVAYHATSVAFVTTDTINVTINGVTASTSGGCDFSSAVDCYSAFDATQSATTGHLIPNTALVISMGSDLGIFGPITSISISPGNNGGNYVVGNTGSIDGFTNDATYQITSVIAGGVNYAPGDTFAFAGGNGDATGNVDTVDGNGSVLTFHVTAQGTGYADATNVATTPTSGSGVGLSVDITTAAGLITAAILSATGGAATGASLTAAGTGYTDAQLNTTATTGVGHDLALTVAVSGPPATGTATITLNYQVISKH